MYRRCVDKAETTRGDIPHQTLLTNTTVLRVELVYAFLVQKNCDNILARLIPPCESADSAEIRSRSTSLRRNFGRKIYGARTRVSHFSESQHRAEIVFLPAKGKFLSEWH